ncbi:MAG: phosphatidate cytidylyltransferase [Candidatus Zixiibacteriota bacterium]|nr:MAG: phosphatidate cytidylyltransferase [candidate division Zixibacteria bacterium]
MTFELSLMVVGLFLAGAFLMLVIHRTKKAECDQRRTDWIKYLTYVGLVSGILLIAVAGKWWLAVFLVLIAVTGSVEILRNMAISKGRRAILFPVFASILLFSLGHLLVSGGIEWFGYFAFVFLLVCVNDSFSQLWGRLVGIHKLCPELSPHKTWEGLLGGILTTVGCTLVMASIILGISLFMAAGIGIVTSLSATAGDLLFSYIKRNLGIKDFSSLLPGHGGVLDRFDSLITAAPVIYWVKKLWIL